jgi:hypothetical protein
MKKSKVDFFSNEIFNTKIYKRIKRAIEIYKIIKLIVLLFSDAILLR